jgi:hypothetical protein
MNAQIFYENEVILYRPTVERHDLDYTGVAEEIADGVRVVATSGHTLDHASLLVATALPIIVNERRREGASATSGRSGSPLPALRLSTQPTMP